MSIHTHTETHTTQTYAVSRVACRSVSSVYSHTRFCIHSFSFVIVKHTHTHTKKYKKTSRPSADKQTQGARYISPNLHSIFTKTFLGKLNSRCWAGLESLLKFTRPDIFLRGPLLLQTRLCSGSPPMMMKFYILSNKMYAILSTETFGCSWQFWDEIRSFHLPEYISLMPSHSELWQPAREMEPVKVREG